MDPAVFFLLMVFLCFAGGAAETTRQGALVLEALGCRLLQTMSPGGQVLPRIQEKSVLHMTVILAWDFPGWLSISLPL